MNQELIGKYIAKKRKEKNLTQKDLAEKLSISEKTISKWECGNGLPEISLMQPLCNELDITVNDLLSGEDVDNNDSNKVIEYIKYKDNKNRTITSIIIIIILLITITLLTTAHIKYKKFYETNYNNNTVYRISGSTEHLSYNNLILIESPSKTIAISGYIESLDEKDIPIESVYKYVLRYKKRIIFGNGGNIYKQHTMLLEEPLGYNELFTEEVLKNKDKWEIDIFYEIDNKKQYETIKLNKYELLSTNKYKNEKVESIDNGESIYTYDPNVDLCNSLYKDFIKRISSYGFKREGERCEFTLDKDNIIIDPMHGKIQYNLSKYSLNILYHGEQNKIYIEKGNNIYEYDIKEKVINCPNEKCLKLDKELEININKFLEIINNYLKDDTN